MHDVICVNLYHSNSSLRADVSKYRPEVYKSEKSKILKKIHKVALAQLLTHKGNFYFDPIIIFDVRGS